MSVLALFLSLEENLSVFHHWVWYKAVGLSFVVSISLRRQWHLTPVLLPGKSHGWRSLVGCSPWDHEESDMTEWLHFHFSLLCIGEGNGNPLQCSCLENPRDGVAQSRTWLKWLSSSMFPLENFYHKWVLNFVKDFPASIEMIICCGWKQCLI